MFGRFGGMASAARLKAYNATSSVLGFAMKNPRSTMAMAGAIGGGMTGGWEGAAVGAGAGALTPRGLRAFGGKQASRIMKGRGWGTMGNRAMGLAGGRVLPGLAMGMAGGLGATAMRAGIGALSTNIGGINKPYSSMGSSFGSMGGMPSFGQSFSGMGITQIPNYKPNFIERLFGGPFLVR